MADVALSPSTPSGNPLDLLANSPSPSSVSRTTGPPSWAQLSASELAAAASAAASASFSPAPQELRASPLVAEAAAQAARQLLTTPPPQAAAEAPVPEGADARSFLLGQRAALQQCFADALPARTALGALQGAFASLHSSVGEGHEALRGVERAVAAADARLAALASLPAALAALDGRVAALETRGATPAWRRSARGALEAFARALLATGGRCDTIVLAFARKVMLDGDASSVRAQRRAAVGSALLLVSVEAAWRLHVAAVRPMPSAVKGAVTPVTRSLAVARGAVWLAAAALTAQTLKTTCFDLADRLLSNLTPASKDEDAEPDDSQDADA